MINEELWDAINEYVSACGGNASKYIGSPKRMNAVSTIERIVRKYRSDAWCEGVDDAIEGIPGGEEYSSAINRHVNDIVNPYEK